MTATYCRNEQCHTEPDCFATCDDVGGPKKKKKTTKVKNEAESPPASKSAEVRTLTKPKRKADPNRFIPVPPEWAMEGKVIWAKIKWDPWWPAVVERAMERGGTFKAVRRGHDAALPCRLVILLTPSS